MQRLTKRRNVRRALRTRGPAAARATARPRCWPKSRGSPFHTCQRCVLLPPGASAALPADARAGRRCVAHQATAAARCALQDAVVDTTGAGDAFIGSVLYALATGLDRPSMLKLAVTVAACKCTAIGARQGLPAAAQLAPHLLQPSLVNA